MQPFLSPTAPPEQESSYDLYGVVEHMGSSFFGHYISSAKLNGRQQNSTKIG